MAKPKREPLLVERVRDLILDKADRYEAGCFILTLTLQQFALYLGVKEKAVRWTLQYMLERGMIEREREKEFGRRYVYKLNLE